MIRVAVFAAFRVLRYARYGDMRCYRALYDTRAFA